MRKKKNNIMTRSYTNGPVRYDDSSDSSSETINTIYVSDIFMEYVSFHPSF